MSMHDTWYIPFDGDEAQADCKRVIVGRADGAIRIIQNLDYIVLTEGQAAELRNALTAVLGDAE